MTQIQVFCMTPVDKEQWTAKRHYNNWLRSRSDVKKIKFLETRQLVTLPTELSCCCVWITLQLTADEECRVQTSTAFQWLPLPCVAVHVKSLQTQTDHLMSNTCFSSFVVLFSHSSRIGVGIDCRQGTREWSRLALEPTQLPIQWARVFLPGGKAAGARSCLSSI